MSATEELDFHMNCVADLAVKIAKLMGLSGDVTDTIYYAGKFHDIGKNKISQEILNKTEKLNDEDWEEIKKHPKLGADLIRENLDIKGLYSIIISHHERYDGTGYPRGLHSNQIPLGARIVSIADSIDAMMSDRCYRKAMSSDQCFQEIKTNVGKMYDPYVSSVVMHNWNLLVG